MLLRSLALRDEAMALCDPAVDMLLWKLAPINDIVDNAAYATILSRPRRVLKPSSGLVSRKSLRSGAQQRCSIFNHKNHTLNSEHIAFLVCVSIHAS